MRRRHDVLWAGVCLALAVMMWSGGCDDVSVDPVITVTFPLIVGDSWTYAERYLATNFDPPEAESLFADTTIGAGTTTISGLDTLSDSIETYVFRTAWNRGLENGEFDAYRNNASDGLFTYAVSDNRIWVGPPKVAARRSMGFLFRGRRFASLDELSRAFIPAAYMAPAKGADTLLYENPPVRDLAYPLWVGRQWAYRVAVPGQSIAIDHRVVGIETVTVPAGVFTCVKIGWLWDLDSDGSWDDDIEGYDYLFAGGLAKRVFRIIGVGIIDEYGQTVCVLDYVDTFELTDYHLEP
jgi:hypothetical protein